MNTMCKNEHKFVFANLNLSNTDSETKWEVVINKRVNWMAFGVCRKDTVIANNYKFSATKGFDHGCFFISSNGFQWNSNDLKENNKKLEISNLQSSFLNGDSIYFKYNSLKEELEIKVKNFTTILTSVNAPDKTTLCPCVVFMNYADEVTFLKN